MPWHFESQDVVWPLLDILDIEDRCGAAMDTFERVEEGSAPGISTAPTPVESYVHLYTHPMW